MERLTFNQTVARALLEIDPGVKLMGTVQGLNFFDTTGSSTSGCALDPGLALYFDEHNNEGVAFGVALPASLALGVSAGEALMLHFGFDLPMLVRITPTEFFRFEIPFLFGAGVEYRVDSPPLADLRLPLRSRYPRLHRPHRGRLRLQGPSSASAIEPRRAILAPTEYIDADEPRPRRHHRLHRQAARLTCAAEDDRGLLHRSPGTRMPEAKRVGWAAFFAAIEKRHLLLSFDPRQRRTLLGAQEDRGLNLSEDSSLHARSSPWAGAILHDLKHGRSHVGEDSIGQLGPYHRGSGNDEGHRIQRVRMRRARR